jgi:hypothetical protein
MGSDSIWECAETYISIFLACEFWALLFVVCYFLLVLFADATSKGKRQAQKLFLLLAMSQSAGRALYFSVLPSRSYVRSNDSSFTCASPAVDETHFMKGMDGLMNVLGTLPACLFLCAFSVNVFTFARIYHTVLSLNRHDERRKPSQAQICVFRFVVAFLVVANIVPLCVLLASYSASTPTERSNANYLTVVLISGETIVIALGFTVYALLLFFGVKKRAEEELRKLSSRMGHSDEMMKFNFTNPMSRLLVVAVLCMICLILKPVVLYFVELGTFSWWQMLCYSTLSEVVPMCLMLAVFQTSRRGGDEPSESIQAPARVPLVHAAADLP